MSLPTFVTPELFAAGQTITLGEREAHHIRVLRLNIGTQVGLRDGHGLRGSGTLVRLAKRHAAVTVEHAVASEPPPLGSRRDAGDDPWRTHWTHQG